MGQAYTSGVNRPNVLATDAVYSMSDAPPPTPGKGRDLTFLLDQAAKGDSHATNELFPRVYHELRAMAESHLGNERAGHTLQPTALVNEAYLRLIGPDGQDTPWENRAHFFGAAAQAIRRILTDHARARSAAKRGGELQRESESLTRLALPESKESPVDFEALDAAVTKLAALDKFKASIVELRYFAGLTGDQTALALGTSPSTIAREWAFIRVWLHRELSAAKPT